MPVPLHVTNGDAAIPALRAGGVTGEIVPWRDVLHDGPVPALPWGELREVRARFIEGRGWAGREAVLADFTRRDAALTDALERRAPVVLWFEHDLYDQLQLMQVLAMAAPFVRDGAPVLLAQADDYLGAMQPTGVRALTGRLRPVTEREAALADSAWQAFTARELEPLRRFAHSPDDDDATGDPLPYLRPALQRLLQEVPNPVTGLSRTELQVLRALAAGPRTVEALFIAAHHEAESPIWLGDASFRALLACLAGPPHPLVAREDERVRLTADGRAVLEGRQNRVARCGLDRWIGGTHLTAPAAP